MSPPHRVDVLILEQDPVVGRMLSEMILESGRTAHVVSSPSEAFRMLRERAIRILISDASSLVSEPEQDLEALRRELPDLSLIVLAGGMSPRRSTLPEALHGTIVLAKPVTVRALYQALLWLESRSRS